MLIALGRIACKRHRVAELFPEWIGVDDWGYPVVDSRPVPRELSEHARRAVDACPALALKLKQAARPS